jgi:hypothetical protein
MTNHENNELVYYVCRSRRRSRFNRKRSTSGYDDPEFEWCGPCRRRHHPERGGLDRRCC